MPLRTRSGKDYDTRGEDKWYEPHRVTKPTKDDEDRAAMALSVVDEIPLDKIRQVIDDNIVDIGHPIIWLADTYDTIPDFDFHPLTPGVEATIADEIADDWRSPFIGSSIDDCVRFMRNAPRPPKGLNIKYCAILQKEMFEAYSCALIVKARGKRSPQNNSL